MNAPMLSDSMSAALGDMRQAGGLTWNGAHWQGHQRHGDCTVRALIRRGLAREAQPWVKIEAIKRGEGRG